MVNSVTFPVDLGGDGSTVTDDDNVDTGLGNGGHLLRFISCLSNMVAICGFTVTKANALAGFSDLYLNSHAADPAVNNQGGALVAGNFYFNTASKLFRGYDGAAWFNAVSQAASPYNFTQATVASHATNADIWTALGNQIDWTGTATTTAFPNAPQAGVERVLICAAACSFTASANMLIDGVASGATVTCAANDQVIVRAVSATQFKLSRIKYDGTPQNGGSINTVNATITSSATLSGTQPLYVPVATTSIGQSIMLPNATTLAVGALLYVIDNTKGGYPVGIRDNAGLLLMAVAAGGEAFVSLKDKSTPAGIWSITGTKLEPGLITIDNTFTATYGSGVYTAFVALDSNISIHFLSIAANGFAAVAVNNTTGAVGMPISISTTASSVPKQAFMVTSTTAVVFYSESTGSINAAVISLSSTTSLSVGGAATLTAANSGTENAKDAPKIVQLDSSHYVVSYATATGAGTTSVAALQITSGTIVAWGSPVNIISANNIADSTATYALSATTALVFYLDSFYGKLNAVIVTVSGNTCALGTPSASVENYANGVPWLCSLSITKFIAGRGNGSNAKVELLTISGTSVSFGSLITIESVDLATNGLYSSDSATRFNAHLTKLTSTTALLWYLNASGVSRTVVITDSAGTLIAGTIVYGAISANSANYLASGGVLPIGPSEFLSLFVRASDSAGTAMSTDALVPHKISGSTITQGSSAVLVPNIPINSPNSANQLCKLSGGDYILPNACTTSSIRGGSSCIDVIRSNGDCVNHRGGISKPMIYSSSAVPAVVSSNRVILIGVTTANNSSSGAYVRLLNVEIAQ